MILTRYLILIVLAALALMGCNNEPSLQKYLVDKQDDDNFLKIDIAASLLKNENSSFTQEEKDILATIKKINVIAYPIPDGVTADYEAEKQKASSILNQEKYKTLMKFGSNTRGATLKYTGEEDAIDEIIVFASDNEKGFAVFRLLGDKMRPEKMIKLMNSIDRGDMDVSQLSGIGELFKM